MKRIPLTGKRGVGRFTLVSDDDYGHLMKFTWNLDVNGYARRTYRVGKRSDNKSMCKQMQRDVLEFMGSDLDGKLVADHINQDKLDNRRSNLRVATRVQNGHNRPTRIGVSGYRGVKPQSSNRNKWQVMATTREGVRKYLGTFNDALEAAREYNRFVTIEHGDFAVLNEV